MTEKDYRVEEFRQVYDVIERMGYASLNQITNATGLQKLKLQRSLSRWVQKGKLFRLGKDKYSVEPFECEPKTYEGKREKLKEQQKASAFLSGVFHNMVKADEVIDDTAEEA